MSICCHIYIKVVNLHFCLVFDVILASRCRPGEHCQVVSFFSIAKYSVYNTITEKLSTVFQLASLIFYTHDGHKWHTFPRICNLVGKTAPSVCVCVCHCMDKTDPDIWQKDRFHLWSRVCLMTTWKTSHIDTRSLRELILFWAHESMCVETWRTQDQSSSAVSAAHVIRQSDATGRHQHSSKSVQSERTRLTGGQMYSG